VPADPFLILPAALALIALWDRFAPHSRVAGEPAGAEQPLVGAEHAG
jgi:hypothetical protein